MAYDPENPFSGVPIDELLNPFDKQHTFVSTLPQPKSLASPAPELPDKLQGIIDSPTLKNVIHRLPTNEQSDRNTFKELNQKLKKVRWPFRMLKTKKILSEKFILTPSELKQIALEYKACQNLTAAKLAGQFGPKIKRQISMGSKSTGLSFLHHKIKSETTKKAVEQPKLRQTPLPLPPRPIRRI